MSTPYWIQLLLLGFYILLAGLFGLDRKTWPLSAYYIGCLVKDSAVFALALLNIK
jgi:hypothetical protein